MRKLLQRAGVVDPSTTELPEELSHESLGLIEQVLPKIDDGKIAPIVREYLEATINPFLAKSTALYETVKSGMSDTERAQLEAAKPSDWIQLADRGEAQVYAKQSGSVKLSTASESLNLAPSRAYNEPEENAGMEVYYGAEEAAVTTNFTVQQITSDGGDSLKFSARAIGGGGYSTTVNMGRLVNGYQSINAAMDRIALQANIELPEY
ncbi:MAG: hypothetical protein JWN82_650 [Candidatus Saccharibacteria bacterium]|nr:hypothetical protein [Candidatus Saccharibacteria bacterium]